jgi:hypothetical protein
MSNNCQDDIEMAEENEFEVESIIDKKKIGNKWKYKVKWLGYSDEESTWEPIENLENVKEMLEEFEKEYAKKQEGITTNLKKSQLKLSIKEKENNLKDSLGGMKKNENKKDEYSNDNIKKNKKKIINEDEENPTEKCLKLVENSPKKEKKVENNFNNQNPISHFKKSKINNSNNVTFKNPNDTNNTEANNNIKNSLTNSMSPISTSPYPITNKNPSYASANTLPTTTITSTQPELKSSKFNDPIVLGDDDDSIKVIGSFESNDIPKRLVTARLASPNNEVNCLVEWLPRKNGIKPQDTFISNKILRDKCPNLLLDFYESRLKFPNNK